MVMNYNILNNKEFISFICYLKREVGKKENVS